jgi:hypothetical protein
MSKQSEIEKLYPKGEVRNLLIATAIKPLHAKSKVWEYFSSFCHTEYPDLVGYSVCLKCSSFLKNGNSTGSLQNHLRSNCLTDERSVILLNEVRI